MFDRISRSLVGAAAAALLFFPGGPAAAQTCVGDCDGGDSVTVDEVITMVNIALGVSEPSGCTAGDADSSGSITVDEILSAVTNALEGCPPPQGGALGTRRFVFDSAQSNFIAVLSPGFEVPLGQFRGQNPDGTLGDAFFEFEAGEPDEDGLAFINITDASEYIVAQAQIADLTICLKPMRQVERAGVIQCNGGLDYSILTTVDRVAGQVGVDGFTIQDCTDLGGTIEGANQACAEGLAGAECFINSDCDTEIGTGDGLCGLATGACPGLLGPGAPCNTNDDCEGGDTCEPVMCTAGKENTTCRNAGDCDTTPVAEDGQCGEAAANPGGCQGPLTLGQIGEDSGAGSVILAPLPEFNLVGLPVAFVFEDALPCGDEGNGGGFSQQFAITTGTARTTIFNFGAGDDDLVFEQNGENFSCSDWSTGSGARFVLSFPALGANPTGGGGDIVTGFTFQEQQ